MAGTVFGEQQNIAIGGNTAGATSSGPGSLFIAGGSNVTLSATTGAGAISVSVSAAPQTVQTQNVVVPSAGTQSATSGTVIFSNSNGISFGMSNSSVITASHNGITSQSAQTLGGYVLGNTFGESSSSTFDARTLSIRGDGLASVGWSQGTLRLSVTQTVQTQGFLNSVSVQGNTGGNTSAGSGSIVFGGGANITLSGTTAAGGMTLGINAAPQTVQTLGAYALGNTTGQSSSSTFDARTFSIEGAGINSVGWSNGSFRVSATQSNQALSAGNGSFAFQTASFSNANGVSFSTSAGSAIVASHNGITSQSNQQISAFAASNTTQSSSGTFNASSVIFAGAGIASVGITNGSVLISVPSGGGAGDGYNILAAGGSTANTTGTIVFSNSNGVSFGLNGATITASHNGITSQSNQQVSLFAVSNTTQATSGTANASNLSFAGAGIASVGVTNGSVVVSVPSGGGAGDGYNILAAGTQTAGTADTVSFANGNGVTFGMSNSSVITASVAAPLMSHYPIYQNSIGQLNIDKGATANPGGASTNTTITMQVQPIVFPLGIAFSQARLIQSYGTAAGTGSFTFAHSMGLYSRTGDTLSQAYSLQNIMEVSQNSVTAISWKSYFGTNSTSNSTSANGNISASLTGGRAVLLGADATTSFSAGQWFMVIGATTRTSNANVVGGLSIAHISEGANTLFADLGRNAASTNWLYPLWGAFTTSRSASDASVATAVNMLPASFNTSIISNTGGTHAKSLYIHLMNSSRS